MTKFSTTTRTARKTTQTGLRKAAASARRVAREITRTAKAIDEGTLAAGTRFVRNDIEYLVRKDGTYERQTSREKPVTREEVVHLLTNVRALEVSEVLEFIGKGAMDFMIKADLLRKMDDGLLWVTVAAQTKYGLKDPILPGTGIKAKYLR